MNKITYEATEENINPICTAYQYIKQSPYEYDFIFTNEMITTEVTVKKIWNDNDNEEGIRPESVTVILFKNNEVMASQDIETDENGEWKYTFTNLPTFENGVECVYTVEEEIPDGYTATIESNKANGFIITNTHIPEKEEEPIKDTKEDKKSDQKGEK